MNEERLKEIEEQIDYMRRKSHRTFTPEGLPIAEELLAEVRRLQAQLEMTEKLCAISDDGNVRLQARIAELENLLRAGQQIVS